MAFEDQHRSALSHGRRRASRELEGAPVRVRPPEFPERTRGRCHRQRTDLSARRKALRTASSTAANPAFGEDDITFLWTYATILGPVIDRLHKAHSLTETLDANRHLLKGTATSRQEPYHISIITSLVMMRARHVRSEEARQELIAVGERFVALRLVNEMLYVAGTTDRLRLRPYVMQLVENLCHLHEGQSGKVRLDFAVEEVDLAPEIAVPRPDP